MIQYNHQIKKGNDNMNKPKITLDELMEIALVMIALIVIRF